MDFVSLSCGEVFRRGRVVPYLFRVFVIPAKVEKRIFYYYYFFFNRDFTLGKFKHKIGSDFMATSADLRTLLISFYGERVTRFVVDSFDFLLFRFSTLGSGFRIYFKLIRSYNIRAVTSLILFLSRLREFYAFCSLAELKYFSPRYYFKYVFYTSAVIFDRVSATNNPRDKSLRAGKPVITSTFLRVHDL